jgi:uncharacterized protein
LQIRADARIPSGSLNRERPRLLPARPAMDPSHLELLVIREMPFGKYAGWIIADLPGSYLNWFARQGFPPGQIGQLLALMHEIDHNGLRPILSPLRVKRRD